MLIHHAWHMLLAWVDVCVQRLRCYHTHIIHNTILSTPHTIPPHTPHHPLHTPHHPPHTQHLPPPQTNDRIAFAAPGTPAPGLTRPAGSPQLHALRLVKALDMPSWWKTAQAVAEEGAGGLLPPRVGATYQDGVPTEAPEELIDPQSDDPFAGA